MKVAISSSGKDLTSQIDPRFGRCAYFIICDTNDMSFEAFQNESSLLGGGAGIQSAQFVASNNVEAVVTGNCGPNAVRTLQAAGVKLFVGQSGTVKEGVERLVNDELKATREANVPDHFGMKNDDTQTQQVAETTGPGQLSNRGMGMGGGRCMGGGRGMGRSMGMGGGRCMGRGMGMTGGNESGKMFEENLSKEQELSLLKKQSEELLRQMEDIQARIERMKKNES